MPSDTNVTRNRTQALIAKLKTTRYDPLDELIAIAKDPGASPKEKKEIALALLPYCYPKLKHVEVDAQVNHGITVQVRQFVKPSDKIENAERKNELIPGSVIPVRSELIPGLPTTRALEDPEIAILAQAGLGMGGHPDIIPDPELPTKRKAV